MKRRHPYIDLWIILTVSLLVVMGVAIYEGDLSLGAYTVKKAPFRESLLGSQTTDSITPLIADEADESALPEGEIDENPQTFLIFGDSMTPNLARRLADYAGANGHTAVHSVNWDSSTCITWAESDKIEHFIAEYQPTFIIVCLGSNESFLRNPSDRKEIVARIISKFNGLPFVWIGPPKFGQQDAYNDMFQEMLPKHYFRSDHLELERGKDNIHPIQSGSNKWMDAVMAWIPSTPHPFRAAKPGPDTQRAKITFDSFAPPTKANKEGAQTAEEEESEESNNSDSSDSSNNSDPSDNSDSSNSSDLPDTPSEPSNPTNPAPPAQPDSI